MSVSRPCSPADLAHSLDHPAAETLAAVVGSDQDLQRAEDGRRRRSFGEPGFDDGVDSPVGQARDVSVPRCWDRVPHADDLLALVVPGVELELGELVDHAAEEAIQDRVVVHELGPGAVEPGCVGLASGPLGAGRELERHVRPSVAEARLPGRRALRRDR